VLAIPRRRSKTGTTGTPRGYSAEAIPGCVIAAYLRKIAAELAIGRMKAKARASKHAPNPIRGRCQRTTGGQS
jgi:hypothetical protein